MTLAAIAAELGVDERTVRRVLADVLEKLRAGLDPQLDLEHFSGEITSYFEIPRRFREASGDGVDAPRAGSAHLPGPRKPASSTDPHAVHLPRRFEARKPR